MQLYGWKPLMVSDNLALCGGHWSAENGDRQCLVFHLTSERFYDFMRFYGWDLLFLFLFCEDTFSFVRFLLCLGWAETGTWENVGPAK